MEPAQPKCSRCQLSRGIFDIGSCPGCSLLHDWSPPHLFCRFQCGRSYFWQLTFPAAGAYVLPPHVHEAFNCLEDLELRGDTIFLGLYLSKPMYPQELYDHFTDLWPDDLKAQFRMLAFESWESVVSFHCRDQQGPFCRCSFIPLVKDGSCAVFYTHHGISMPLEKIHALDRARNTRSKATNSIFARRASRK